MKKILLLILTVGFWSAESIAQMQKGSWMLEGSAGLEKSRSYFPDMDEKSSPTTGYTLYPKAGIFIQDNLALGISGLFGSSWTKNKSASQDSPMVPKKWNTIQTGVGVFLRKYVTIKESLTFFGEIGSEVSWENEYIKYTDPNLNFERNNGRKVQAQGILGIQYLISPKVGVHMQTNLLQYSNMQGDSGSIAKNSEFRAGFLSNPRFGFTIFL